MSSKHRLLAALLAVVATATPAFAGKVLVLKSEGRADAATRARVDATVARLAQAGKDEAAPGEITYTDAAAMVGCKPEEAACRDEVIGMLAVDEIVIVQVTPKPGAFEVHVRRAGRGGAAREASTTVAVEALDRLDAIAPLFGGAAPTALPAPTGAPTEATGPAMDAAQPPAATELRPLPPPVDAGPPHPNRRLHLAGIVTGSAFTLLGLIMWGSAASVQSEIDDAPTATASDLANLADLEQEGDGYAAAGNLLVISGLVIGGISTYLYVRGRGRARAQVAPAVMGNGTGLGLTIGGTL